MTADAKRRAVIAAFKAIPIDSGNLDFLYRRRHLAKVRDGKWRELRYIGEYFDLQEQIWRTLDRIRERDGDKIAREVAEGLAQSIEDAARKS